MPTPDLSEFEKLSQPRRTGCSVGLALNELKGEEQEQLKAALARASITHAAISQWLKARKRKVDGMTVGRHRRGVCTCDAA